ncbi:hypothetical protein [Gordonia malaquae]|uniref:hypothetical protein n=1 Tax=Gordonia malaquae TaxID=410332 RepID=UPI0037BEE84C
MTNPIGSSIGLGAAQIPSLVWQTCVTRMFRVCGRGPIIGNPGTNDGSVAMTPGRTGSGRRGSE